MSKRTNKVIVSPEGRVLKKLRQKKTLSMRSLADLLAVSDSYISQIENGRADCSDAFLGRILPIYEISRKYFFELCRDWEKESTDEDFIRDNLSKVSKENQKLLKAMVTTMLVSR